MAALSQVLQGVASNTAQESPQVFGGRDISSCRGMGACWCVSMDHLCLDVYWGGSAGEVPRSVQYNITYSLRIPGLNV